MDETFLKTLNSYRKKTRKKRCNIVKNYPLNYIFLNRLKENSLILMGFKEKSLSRSLKKA